MTEWQVGFLSQGFPNHPCHPSGPHMGRSPPYSLGTRTTSSSLPHRPGGTRWDGAGDSGTGPTWKVLDAMGTTGGSAVKGSQPRARVRWGLGALPDGERGSPPLCPMRQLWLKPNSMAPITTHHLLPGTRGLSLAAVPPDFGRQRHPPPRSPVGPSCASFIRLGVPREQGLHGCESRHCQTGIS